MSGLKWVKYGLKSPRLISHDGQGCLSESAVVLCVKYQLSTRSQRLQKEPSILCDGFDDRLIDVNMEPGDVMGTEVAGKASEEVEG